LLRKPVIFQSPKTGAGAGPSCGGKALFDPSAGAVSIKSSASMPWL
jgi:hypothetical protein